MSKNDKMEGVKKELERIKELYSSKENMKKKDMKHISGYLNKIAFSYSINYHPILRAEAGEIIGELGDNRKLYQFIKVPEGHYIIGPENKRVYIEPFEMSKYPVTNKWFKKFIDSAGYNYKEKPYWSNDFGLKNWIEKECVHQPRYWDLEKWNCSNKPVVGVNWFEAMAFCNWLTYNDTKYQYCLPTEKQWEAAARGSYGRTYPWGNEFKDGYDYCNYYDTKLRKTSTVGIFLKGETPVTKFIDMIGNVWEWCYTSYKSDFYNEDSVEDLDVSSYRVVHGGSWAIAKDLCNCSFRIGDPPDLRGNDVGFRVIRFFRENLKKKSEGI